MTALASKVRKLCIAISTPAPVVSDMVSIALGIALLLRWPASSTHDSENSCRYVFAFALLGTALYALILREDRALNAPGYRGTFIGRKALWLVVRWRAEVMALMTKLTMYILCSK